MHHDTSLPVCRRCGECCRRGGPALHREDLPLVQNGRIPLASLITLRRGETVRDNVTGGLTTLDTEMVRVGPAGETPTCPFFREPGQCLIHDQSPAECRALFCAAPEALTAMYRTDRVCRLDLLPAGGPGRELVAAHEARCPAGEAVRLCLAARASEGAGRDLNEMLRFDAALRELCVTRGAVARDELDFHFGRALSLVVAPFSRAWGTRGTPFSAPRIPSVESEP